jgi:hypothetical protein
MLDDLKGKTTQEKLNDAMNAMANLHEVFFPFKVFRPCGPRAASSLCDCTLGPSAVSAGHGVRFSEGKTNDCFPAAVVGFRHLGFGTALGPSVQ